MSEIFTPSDHQFEAMLAIRDWYFNGKKQWFYLGGYAGTGKSSIIRPTVEACEIDSSGHDVAYGTYTGKASWELRKKNVQSSTVHSLTYRFTHEDEDGQPRFILNDESILNEVKLLVLDECSMIDDDMAIDMLSFGKKILVVGDPAQIGPVSSKQGFFTRNEPDFMLTEIHRQAKDNPIIHFSTLIRENKPIPFGDYGELVKIRQNDFDFDQLLSCDQILTGKNKTRQGLNMALKNQLGYTEVFPTRKGIKLICLKNKRDLNLYNGLIGYTTGDIRDLNSEKKSFLQSLTESYEYKGMEHEDIKMYTGHFSSYVSSVNLKEDSEIIKANSLSEFDYAYAITVHKAQGSQWKNVVLWDDQFGKGFNPDDRRRWLYTALTRAEERITVVV